MVMLATNKEHYKKLENNQLSKAYKRIAESSESKRVDKFAITQIIVEGRFALNFDAAILYSFRGTSKTLQLTKKEKKALKLAYEISQADLSSQIIATLFCNERLSNNLKLLSQIKKYIDNQDSDNKASKASGLNIFFKNHTDKQAKDQNNKTPKPTKASSLELVKQPQQANE